jgi:nicotinamide-nucleotide amidase
MKKNADNLVKLLQKKKLTLFLAESITCGMAADKLGACKGTSEVLAGSVVTYMPESKMQLLGISKTMIDKYTCESKEVTDAMAKKSAKLVKADIYAALTGLASNGGSENKSKPVGTVFFTVIFGKKIARKRKVFNGTPTQIRKKACLELYGMIGELVD